MQRRDFLRVSSSFATTAVLVPSWAAPQPLAQDWRTFDVTTRIHLAEKAGPSRVWIPLPMEVLKNYQKTLSVAFDAPGAQRAEIMALPGTDVRMLVVEWKDTDTARDVRVNHRVATQDRQADLAAPAAARNNLPAAALRPYLQPTALAPLDGIVRETADKIQAEAGHPTDPIEKARAIYTWMLANCSRNGSVAGCGTGDVRYMLTSGNLSGKCADINGLFTALARASGVPARDVYGVRVDDSAHGFKSLGKSGDISKAQHCRAEFYAAGYGWIPVDPADVRKVMLEEAPGGLPATAARVRAAAAMLFGAWEGNWMAYNTGADVQLPGGTLAPVGFLMYPQGETVQGRLDSLDPANFTYQITSAKV